MSKEIEEKIRSFYPYIGEENVNFILSSLESKDKEMEKLREDVKELSSYTETWNETISILAVKRTVKSICNKVLKEVNK